MVAVLLLCLLPATVLGSPVPVLRGAITDETGLLEEGRAQIEAAQNDLFQRTGVQLYTLWVETTGGADIGQFTIDVGRENQLGDRDALLVVAVEDRQNWLELGEGLNADVSQIEVDSIIRDMGPQLADSDFPGAVVGAAQGLQAAVGAVAPVPGGTPVPGSTPAPRGGGIDLLPVLLVLGIIGIGAWIFLRFRRERDRRRVAFQEAAEQERLGREANGLLIRTDDALRDAEQELGFAEAQFGAAQAAAMGKALVAAREELRQAFTIGQRLDDAEPESAEQRRAMIQEIIERCQRAQGAVDEQREAVERLRDLEKNAPQVLAALPASIDEVERRLPAAQESLARLDRYAQASWKAVAGNVDAARDRVAAARKHLAAGQAGLSGNDRSAAAVEARAAQERITEASGLLEAIDKTSASLDEAAARIETELRQVQADIAQARAAMSAGTAPERGAALAQAETALAAVQRAAGAERPDVTAVMRQLTAVDGMVDELLAGIRAADEQRRRSAQLAAMAISAAEGSIAQAEDYISGYRRSQSLGRRARNRLDDARRYLGAGSSAASDRCRSGGTTCARLTRSPTRLSGWPSRTRAGRPWAGAPPRHAPMTGSAPS